MFDGLRAQRLLALFLGGWLVLDFPLLALWDRDVTVMGLPLFPVALFVLWGLGIVLVAMVTERGEDGPDEADPAAPAEPEAGRPPGPAP